MPKIIIINQHENSQIRKKIFFGYHLLVYHVFIKMFIVLLFIYHCYNCMFKRYCYFVDVFYGLFSIILNSLLFVFLIKFFNVAVQEKKIIICRN